MELKIETLIQLDLRKAVINDYRSCGGRLLHLKPENYICIVHHFPNMNDRSHLEQCAYRCPGQAIRYMGRSLSQECLDWCAEQRPADALKHAAARLSRDRLDLCAEQYPGHALRYAAMRLTRWRRDWCVRHRPAIAHEMADKTWPNINATHKLKWI